MSSKYEWLLPVAAAVLLLASVAIATAQPVVPGGRKVFANSVTPIPVGQGRAQGLIVNSATDTTRSERMDVMFSLDLPQGMRKSLEDRVAKGETVPLAELDRDVKADAAAADKLVTWLKQQGFRITSVSPDRTSVYANATVATIEKALQVEMVSVTREGRTYPAARNAPSLPADVGDSVHAIVGLQPYRHARKHAIRLAVASDDAPIPSTGSPPPVPTPQVANKPPYLVKEILKAYNANGLNVTGAGEKIAILIDTFPAKTDMRAFAKKNGIAYDPNKLELINVSGKTLPPREGEETLDAQWAGGIAPGATVRIYASGSLQFVALDRALDRIYEDLKTQPKIHQVSISLGLGETFMSPGEVAAQHQKFLKLAAAGVNVFVSSGDAGSNPDETGHGSGGPLQAEYESSDSSVIGVGGTSLTVDPSTGAAVAEVAWAGSGGGESIFFDRPPWQRGAGVPDAGKRLVPDVSLAAEPERGAYIYFQGEEQQIGGTSWSAPVWAGFCALMNEARAKAGKKPLPYLNPLIYPQIGKPAFRDITAGSNGSAQAGAGYDKVTGIGVPDVKELTKALVK